MKAEDILGEDYGTYRNVRAVAVLFILMGSILTLAGIIVLFGKQPPPKEEQMPIWAAWVMAATGVGGAVGGVAVLLGSRRWSKLAYVIAAFYTLGFPVGTIMGYTFLTGLPKYFDCKERLARADLSGPP
jgi:hypothetical protein